MSVPKFSIVIIGGGFSGTILAVQLLRRDPALSIAIIDKGSALGRGVAYGTRHSCHLLNVPAAKMSALPEEPESFLNWARANHDPQVQPTDFLPRLVYGRYVAALLADAAKCADPGAFRWIQGEASSLAREHTHITVQLNDGRNLATETVVLAAGNFPPANLNIPGISGLSKQYVPSAWSADAMQDIPQNGDVLLIGSGLTSLDLAIALKTEGFTGQIHILSRRGLMPHSHRPTGRWPQFWNEQSPRTIRGLLRLVRQQVKAASETGISWHAVIDALRPMTQNIWQSLPLAEHGRFLRHARAYWEVHRHRVAPEIGATVAGLIQQGQIHLHAGRIKDYREEDDYAEVRLRDRKTGLLTTLRVDRVINCTGPETDCRRIGDPLIKSLLAQGLAQPDPLFLGLDSDEHGAMIGRNGIPSDFLYAIGPARKGALWETTAVPEIRVQASRLGEYLALRLAPSIVDRDYVTYKMAIRDMAAIASD